MSSDALTALADERYINLETYKRNGDAVLTPVWFAIHDGALMVMTNGTSYKVKRLRRNDKVRVAACGARGKIHGPFYEGTGALVTDPEVEREALARLQKKYGWQMRLIKFTAWVGRRRDDWVVLRLDV